MLDSFRAKFIILSIIVAISGFSQGMLLPLIAYIFEHRAIDASISGIHASGLYIGVFLSALFIEVPLRKYGYRKLIVAGGLIVSLALLAFPILDGIIFWFILRLIVGVADNALHFSTQTWLTDTTPRHKIGRVIAFYGLFFSAGFMIGPKVSELVEIAEPLPFIVSGVLTMLAWPLIFLLKGAKDEKPSDNGVPISFISTLVNFKNVLKSSWVVFLFPLMFGVLEGSLHTNFPVYGLREGLEYADITWILPAFSFGAILFQIPIGALGDKIGRPILVSILLLLGGSVFILLEFVKSSLPMYIVLFALAGACLGSMYSLGITYMTDITPRFNLPAGNLMAGIFFSVGSISGPVLGGTLIDASNGTSYFIFFSIIVVILFICNVLFIWRRKILSEEFKERMEREHESSTHNY
ncbi:MFS transporter [Aliicoccus persicus]|uniref:Predicted arabinose efflux permease, MFS family n=1 Tax=Aliicoccus persicus TaxID=930138 RepID=A0A662Z4W7_9STAP|nr:MFS transporter [Aliicoccus persicus]SEW11506.1 Predicted arabinose efflux permease, MFS family [Aliicoccus persicus]